MGPIRSQRVEGGGIAVLMAVATVALGFSWWWLLVLFLVFDLSMLGYLANARVGALVYNLGHSLLLPATLLIIFVITEVRWPGLIGLAWAFHIGVDRALGYGLKLADGFHHTHLGRIGPAKRRTA